MSPSGERTPAWSAAELDRSLAPVRRVLAWVQADPGRRAPVARHAGPIVRAWVARAGLVTLPGAIRDRVAVLGERARALEASAEPATFAAAFAELAELDRLLGLPVRRTLKPVERPDWRAAEPEPEPRPATPVPSAPPSEAAPTRREWSGRLEASLADAGLPDDLVDALAAVGIHTAGALLGLRPTASTPLGAVRNAGDPLGGGAVALSGRTTAARWTVLHPDGRAVPWRRVQGSGGVDVAFRRADERDAVGEDARVVLAGRVAGAHTLTDAEPLSRDEGAKPSDGAWLMSYGLGDADPTVRAGVRVLEPRLTALRDPLSTVLPSGMPPLQRALKALHARPDDEAARRRMAFGEVFLAQIGLSWERFRTTRDRGLSHAVLHSSSSRLGVWGDVLFDDPQQLAFEDIKRDLRLSWPMLRTLTGDVGAGKGTIALAAAAMVAESRHQVLFLTPDAATAEQRFAFAEARLREAGLVGRLVLGEPTNAMRDALVRGEVHIVFGTFGLLERSLDFRRLGLVVGLERDAWGRVSSLVRQLRAPRPDALIVTSTPIGVPIALTAYPDHDLTVVRSAPVRVQSRVHRDAERASAYGAVAESVARGEQALVVFPMVRGQDALDPREAERVVRAISTDAVPGARVALFHGAISRDERQRVYRDFVHRRIDVLVATTHVEDAPPVPGATTVVVEQAHRVPIARIKRICGFVKGSGEAHAHLVVGPDADVAEVERLVRLAGSPSGLAMADSEVDIAGIAQVTAPGAFPMGRWRWLETRADRDLVLAARAAAHRTLREDPGLRRPAHAVLARLARATWDELWPDGPPCPVPEGGGEKRRRRRRRRRK